MENPSNSDIDSDATDNLKLDDEYHQIQLLFYCLFFLFLMFGYVWLASLLLVALLVRQFFSLFHGLNVCWCSCLSARVIFQFKMDGYLCLSYFM